MVKDEVINEYFEWMYKMVCDKRYSKDISFRKLLMFLHDTEFVYLIPKDANRAEDGVDLRYRFAIEVYGVSDTIMDYLLGPCSVLEMILALAIRCEENIMDDPRVGDRMNQWFWGMINNLHLGSMVDTHFDRDLVDQRIDIFLNRDYEPNGDGGLFTIMGCPYDLRDVEIWIQLCWYLDSIT